MRGLLQGPVVGDTVIISHAQRLARVRMAAASRSRLCEERMRPCKRASPRRSSRWMSSSRRSTAGQPALPLQPDRQRSPRQLQVGPPLPGLESQWLKADATALSPAALTCISPAAPCWRCSTSKARCSPSFSPSELGFGAVLVQTLQKLAECRYPLALRAAMTLGNACPAPLDPPQLLATRPRQDSGPDLSTVCTALGLTRLAGNNDLETVSGVFETFTSVSQQTLWQSAPYNSQCPQ